MCRRVCECDAPVLMRRRRRATSAGGGVVERRRVMVSDNACAVAGRWVGSLDSNRVTRRRSGAGTASGSGAGTAVRCRTGASSSSVPLNGGAPVTERWPWCRSCRKNAWREILHAPPKHCSHRSWVTSEDAGGSFIDVPRHGFQYKFLFSTQTTAVPLLSTPSPSAASPNPATVFAIRAQLISDVSERSGLRPADDTHIRRSRRHSEEPET